MQATDSYSVMYYLLSLTAHWGGFMDSTLKSNLFDPSEFSI